MEPNPPLSQIDGRGIVAAKIATPTEFFLLRSDSNWPSDCFEVHELCV